MTVTCSLVWWYLNISAPEGLREKLIVLQKEQEVEKLRNHELAEQFAEKGRQFQKLQLMYDKLKRKSLMPPQQQPLALGGGPGQQNKLGQGFGVPLHNQAFQTGQPIPPVTVQTGPHHQRIPLQQLHQRRVFNPVPIANMTAHQGSQHVQHRMPLSYSNSMQHGPGNGAGVGGRMHHSMSHPQGRPRTPVMPMTPSSDRMVIGPGSATRDTGRHGSLPSRMSPLY
ncbi:hypothetical protein SpCBS45565_g00024 [Spizellomyces sp. 'palustris']|nr:hypothetical protein SpCBS45565_g00024 [Spizellomyces sp. 'palustris']